MKRSFLLHKLPLAEETFSILPSLYLLNLFLFISLQENLDYQVLSNIYVSELPPSLQPRFPTSNIQVLQIQLEKTYGGLLAGLGDLQS